MLVRTLALLACLALAGAASSDPRWYKGATHLHSLWSDGNAAPEYVIQWYASHGWDFVCPSDHNTLLEGEKYFEIAEGKKLTPARVDELKSLFGEDWVVLKDGRMRLKTLEELREHFEKPGKFILVSAEEMTTIGGNPHMNAINVREAVGGLPNEGSKSGLIQYYLDTVAAQSKKFHVPMIVHLNHVNFSDRITTEEIIGARGLALFEVYNGHGSVHSWGIPSEGAPSSERHWDVVNSMKQLREPGYLLYAVATDDSHEYFDFHVGTSNPGRGWIMVRARSLKAKALVNAMRKGDFYASTGVELKDIRRGRKSLAIMIAGEDGVTYTTQYIGTRKGFNQETRPAVDAGGNPLPRSSLIYSDQIGEVLYETHELASEYPFKGDEMYVRARVVSDRLQPNPHEDGDYEMAWVQPVLVK